jgi:hypothetical protein
MSGYRALFSLSKEFFTGPIGFGIGTWILAGIFAWSGAAKLRQPRLAALAMFDFGVIKKPIPGLGRTLGAGESLLSLLLAASALAGYKSALSVFLFSAAALLWLFVALIGRSLTRGQTFACFCFGDTESTLSGWTAVRTSALAFLATIMAIASLGRADPTSTARIILLQAESAAALLGTIALIGQLPKLLRRSDDPLLIHRLVST